jgi:hypothetical protein
VNLNPREQSKSQIDIKPGQKLEVRFPDLMSSNGGVIRLVKDNVIERRKQGDPTIMPEWTDNAPIIISSNLHALKSNPALTEQISTRSLST